MNPAVSAGSSAASSSPRACWPRRRRSTASRRIRCTRTSWRAARRDIPLVASVERVRDGRSMAARRVSITQDGRPLLALIASFHASPVEPQLADPPPAVPAPEELPSLQDWVRRSPPEIRPGAEGNWIVNPPPVQIRMGEALRFLGGAAGKRHPIALDAGAPRRRRRSRCCTRRCWRTRAISSCSTWLSGPTRRACRRRRSPRPASTTRCGFTVPLRFDEWLLHTQETVAISGDRGLVRGALHDAQGRLVATAMQEVLVRVRQ